MPQVTLCSRCGGRKLCYQMRVVGPSGHKLEGEVFEICSQKCLGEVIAENVRVYGPFQVTEYNDA